MAIEMIENNDFGNFSEGRLGLKQFADEGYNNYTGSENFYNLFGSQKKKKKTTREQTREKYSQFPSDCDKLQTSIDLISNDVATLLKRKSTLEVREALDETNKILGEYKNKQILQGCQEVKAAKESEAQRIGTLETLTKLSDISVSKAQSELAGLSPTDSQGFVEKNKKLLMYGGAGLAAILVIALIAKR